MAQLETRVSGGSELKGLLSDIIHLEDKPTNQYRLTIKRLKKLPVGKYVLMIGKHECELTIQINKTASSKIEKVGYIRHNGSFDLFHFTRYCEGSGTTIEIVGYNLILGLYYGGIHINDTNIIGQKKNKING